MLLLPGFGHGVRTRALTVGGKHLLHFPTQVTSEWLQNQRVLQNRYLDQSYPKRQNLWFLSEGNAIRPLNFRGIV